MGFSLKFRELLPDGVAMEFDALFKSLREFLLLEHNEDGSHRPNALTFPIGGMMPFAGTTAPPGWLICDGTAVSRATYKTLLETIGTAYGVGDGNTTFNLPDLRQRMPLGKAASGTGATMGATGGAIDHTHTGGSHTHSISSDGSHGHGGNTGTGGTGSTGGASTKHRHGSISVDDNNDGLRQSVMNYADDTPDHTHAGPSHSHSISSDGAHTHGGATGSAGTGTTSTANPPFQVVQYIIFTGVGV